METETHSSEGLTLEVRRDEAITVTWRGRSTARDPSRFLLPILTHLVEAATADGRSLVLDFRALDYLNSSTLAPLVRILDAARRGTASVVVQYSRPRKWQTLSFSALEVFQTTDGRVVVEGTQ